LFLAQFRNVLIVGLLFASGLAAAIGNVKDAAAIAFVVVVNAIVGFYREHRAATSSRRSAARPSARGDGAGPRHRRPPLTLFD
jgi:magnesium-transporting ATPase (P-type)